MPKKPLFEQYEDIWRSKTNIGELKKYDPEKLFKHARTFEELQLVRKSLGNEHFGHGAIWDTYHDRRLALSKQASYYGNGLFGAPVEPQLYRRYEDVQGKRAWAYNRNLYGDTLSHNQIAGNEPLFKVNSAGGKPKIAGLNVPAYNPAKTNLKNSLVFDLETTGLLNKKTDILDYSSSLRGKERSVFGRFVDPGGLDEYVHREIIPRWQKGIKAHVAQGGQAVGQKEIVESFIRDASKAESISGYNIKSFDLPLMKQQAAKFGLSKELSRALKGKPIVDVAEQAKSFLMSSYGDTVIGLQPNVTKMKQPLGWQLGAVAKGFGYEASSGQALSDAAHAAIEDSRMAKFVHNKLQSRDAQKSFNFKAYSSEVELLTKKQLKLVNAGMGTASYENVLSRELHDMPFDKYVAREAGDAVPSSLAATATKSTATKEVKGIKGIASRIAGSPKAKYIGAGARFLGMSALSAAVLPGNIGYHMVSGGAFEAGYHLGGKGVRGAGFGLAASAGVFAFSNLFSGKDDEYNTIEGLRHGGMAQNVRQTHTEFGSGWQRGASNLQEFTEDYDPTDVKAEIAERQAAYQETLGSFSTNEFLKNVNVIQGINLKNKRLRQVRLEKFKIDVEDADTIVLRRRDAKTTAEEKPIYVRLGGIDAPETAAHEDDPLESVRVWQDQPYGEEASDVLRSLIEQQEDLSLIVGTGKTYGRYVGALTGDDSVLNIELAKQGAVAGLPFGSETKEVVSREAIAEAEDIAQREGSGMWQFGRYQAIAEAHEAIGGDITFNTLTRMDKMAENEKLANFATYLAAMGETKGQLTQSGEERGRSFGLGLRSDFGPFRIKGIQPGYNKFPGMPTEEAWSSAIREDLTQFKKGFSSKFDLFKKYIGAKGFKEALGSGKRIRQLGKRGGYGEAFLYETEFAGERIQYAVKKTYDRTDKVGKTLAEQFKASDERQLAVEFKALRDIDGEIMPSAYGMSDDGSQLFMEYMPGKTLQELVEEGMEVPGKVWHEARMQANQMAMKGYKSTDLNPNNLMYDPASGRTSWIDFGLAEKTDDMFAAQEDMLRVIRSRSETVKPLKTGRTLKEILADKAARKERAALKVQTFGEIAAKDEGSMLYDPSFSGSNKPIDAIEGLHPGADNSLGAEMIKKLTPHGSKTIGKKVVSFAKNIFSKNKTKDNLFDLLPPELLADASKRALPMSRRLEKILPEFGAVTVQKNWEAFIGDRILQRTKSKLPSLLGGRKLEQRRNDSLFGELARLSIKASKLKTKAPVLVSPKFIKGSSITKEEQTRKLLSTLRHEFSHQEIRDLGQQELVAMQAKHVPKEFREVYAAAAGKAQGKKAHEISNFEFVDEFLAYGEEAAFKEGARAPKISPLRDFLYRKNKATDDIVEARRQAHAKISGILNRQQGKLTQRLNEPKFYDAPSPALSPRAREQFRKTSKESVGIGLQMANNATKGHY